MEQVTWGYSSSMWHCQRGLLEDQDHRGPTAGTDVGRASTSPERQVGCATPRTEAQYSLLGTSAVPNNLEVTLLMVFCPPNLQWM